MRRTLNQCPMCDGELTLTELQCGQCGTTLQGSFPATQCIYCTLPEDQASFLELFLRRRGNLRDVERALGLSYPTVRARLDQVLASLGFGDAVPEIPSTGREDALQQRREILEELDRGGLSPEEAVRLLEELD